MFTELIQVFKTMSAEIPVLGTILIATLSAVVGVSFGAISMMLVYETKQNCDPQEV